MSGEMVKSEILRRIGELIRKARRENRFEAETELILTELMVKDIFRRADLTVEKARTFGVYPVEGGETFIGGPGGVEA